MGGSRKKVIVRLFSPGALSGYLSSAGFLSSDRANPCVDLLDLAGRVQPVPLDGIKYISFVRDFNASDALHPERLLRRSFSSRPRSEGLWLRLSLRDDDTLEGLAPLDLSLVDSLLMDGGVQMVPPDIRGNTQRLYVPRSAMTSLQIVAVVTTPSRKQNLPAERLPDVQTDLVFSDSPAKLAP